jgi:RNA polymerase sigma-70 factor (ECF subfamily)
MATGERDTPHSLLLRLAQQRRDDRAWDEFVQRYRPRIARWCRERGLQEADAEDVTQIVLQQLLGAMREFRYDPAGSFRAWLQTVTSRACGRFRLAETRLAGRKDDEALKSIEEAPARQDLARRIEEAFDEELLQQATEAVQARIEYQTWEAYRLTAIERLSGAEAAQQLGMPVMNVYVARRRVQEMLRREVERLEQDVKEPDSQ